MLDRFKVANSDEGLREQVKALIPGGNLSARLTCGSCASGCPASGIHDLDPGKFVRMAVSGMDKELERHPWVWACTMCRRCYDALPHGRQYPPAHFLFKVSMVQG